MMCDICKIRPATVHIKEFHNGECKSTHLCAECAEKREEQGELGALGFKLSELLFNAAAKNAGKTDHQPEQKSAAGDSSETDPLTCPVCSWTTGKIRSSNGKVGCPECYKVFSSLLAEAFSQVQRGSIHLGKTPRCANSSGAGVLRQELKKLQTELADSVSREEYEHAAVCRDRINLIRKQLEEMEQ